MWLFGRLGLNKNKMVLLDLSSTLQKDTQKSTALSALKYISFNFYLQFKLSQLSQESSMLQMFLQIAENVAFFHLCEQGEQLWLHYFFLGNFLFQTPVLCAVICLINTALSFAMLQKQVLDTAIIPWQCCRRLCAGAEMQRKHDEALDWMCVRVWKLCLFLLLCSQVCIMACIILMLKQNPAATCFIHPYNV